MTKQIFAPINKALFLATAISLSVIAPIYSAQASNTMESVQIAEKKTYLGVIIDKVPVSLQQQLGNVLPQNQGILVREVVEGSPAQKAQLQPYDILLSYNEQKLFSPKQLTQLVKSTKNGEQVTLNIIRNGQAQPVQVTIGEIASNDKQHQPMHHRYGQHHPMHHQRMPFDNPWLNKNMGKNWDSFQSLSLEKLKDNQYKAAIEILDKDGNKQRFQFQGSRTDIQEQIQQQEQLPKREKQQLMNLLSANSTLKLPDIGSLMNNDFFSQSPFDWKSNF